MVDPTGLWGSRISDNSAGMFYVMDFGNEKRDTEAEIINNYETSTNQQNHQSVTSGREVCSNQFSDDCSFETETREEGITITACGVGYPISGFDVVGNVYPKRRDGSVGQLACPRKGTCGNIRVGSHALGKRTIKLVQPSYCQPYGYAYRLT